MLQFFCFLLIIVVAEIAAGVWAYSNRDGLEKYVESSVRSTVQDEYGTVDTRTQTFDAIQKGVCISFFLITLLLLKQLEFEFVDPFGSKSLMFQCYLYSGCCVVYVKCILCQKRPQEHKA
jgi:hypothetical protein